MTDEIVKIAQKDLDNALAARKTISGAGRANRSNLVKIESDIATKKINLADAEFNRDTSHRMLKILAGIDVDEPLNLTDDFPKDFPKMEDKKLTNTPEWQVLDQQVKMYESKASSQRAGGYPTLAAVGSYNYVTMDQDLKHLFNENASQSAYLGLALKVPIFSGGLNSANATVDAMNAEVAHQDLDKSKKITSEKYTNAIKQYNHLCENLKGLENARNLAAKAYGFSRDRFAAGQTSAVELADVSAGLYQLDMALLNVKYKILMSAVSKHGESYKTPFGDFRYYQIPDVLFGVGVRSEKTSNGTYLMANPTKALCDTLLRKRLLRVTSPKSLRDFLETDMRFDFDYLGEPDRDVLRAYAACGRKTGLFNALERMFA